ncbi:MAG: RNA-binding domain-containing protein [Thermoplasmata archaeon]
MKAMALPSTIKEVLLRTFEHATESHEKVLLALETISGSKDYRQTLAEGYYGNRIAVLETVLTSKEAVGAFWERLRSRGLLAGIEENLEERVNDSGELFLRFDKQAAVEGRLVLSQGDDVVIARARVRGFPTGAPTRCRRDRVIEEVRHFLRELGGSGIPERSPDS